MNANLSTAKQSTKCEDEKTSACGWVAKLELHTHTWWIVRHVVVVPGKLDNRAAISITFLCYFYCDDCCFCCCCCCVYCHLHKMTFHIGSTLLMARKTNQMLVRKQLPSDWQLSFIFFVSKHTMEVINFLFLCIVLTNLSGVAHGKNNFAERSMRKLCVCI